MRWPTDGQRQAWEIKCKLCPGSLCPRGGLPAAGCLSALSPDQDHIYIPEQALQTGKLRRHEVICPRPHSRKEQRWGPSSESVFSAIRIFSFDCRGAWFLEELPRLGVGVGSWGQEGHPHPVSYSSIPVRFFECPLEARHCPRRQGHSSKGGCKMSCSCGGDMSRGGRRCPRPGSEVLREG